MASLAFYGSNIIYAWLPKLTTLGVNTAANSGPFYTCRQMIAVRLDSATNLYSATYNSTAKYIVCTMPSIPTLHITRIPSRVYVPDDLVASYKTANGWSSLTINPLSQLPTDYPACPWLDDLRENGFIS